ncbi:hypothetical protein FGO68_gene4003 [Halteria grandinella]|uniref:Uncharacterized protein n=1 Tax=Halteria grandinella TaxID=5974 RepID=A0A8J8P528_HALGN|nr:hypothetical protein FGO68_gene4003 [Halteria grandinella]
MTKFPHRPIFGGDQPTTLSSITPLDERRFQDLAYGKEGSPAHQYPNNMPKMLMSNAAQHQRYPNAPNESKKVFNGADKLPYMESSIQLTHNEYKRVPIQNEMLTNNNPGAFQQQILQSLNEPSEYVGIPSVRRQRNTLTQTPTGQYFEQKGQQKQISTTDELKALLDRHRPQIPINRMRNQMRQFQTEEPIDASLNYSSQDAMMRQQNNDGNEYRIPPQPYYHNRRPAPLNHIEKSSTLALQEYSNSPIQVNKWESKDLPVVSQSQDHQFNFSQAMQPQNPNNYSHAPFHPKQNSLFSPQNHRPQPPPQQGPVHSMPYSVITNLPQPNFKIPVQQQDRSRAYPPFLTQANTVQGGQYQNNTISPKIQEYRNKIEGGMIKQPIREAIYERPQMSTHQMHY